ncbi:hypothetical protein LOD99_186 [Oopsacas minuta]|uniref:Uncharacterized protein n=1 Tax=Oopsacas minuta TaxID=111878 RepID=A0AAV7K8W4_9METZ|nr:hypothetical protein LOD99_186 [Oopsacas minuta]
MEEKLRDTVESKVNSSTGLCNECTRYQAPENNYTEKLYNTRFQDVEKMIDTTIQICHMRGSVEAQTGSIITVCDELLRLLKMTCYENFELAKKVEQLTDESNREIRRVDDKVKYLDLEQKITKRNLKTVRKKSRTNTPHPYKPPEEPIIKHEHNSNRVITTDYDSLKSLCRSSGKLDLEFMLRMNQLMSDFVQDTHTNELNLPPMGQLECEAVTKLAQVYKLRYRFNKTRAQSSTTYLIKARQTTMPASGEVDLILNSFADMSNNSIDQKQMD